MPFVTFVDFVCFRCSPFNLIRRKSHYPLFSLLIFGLRRCAFRACTYSPYPHPRRGEPTATGRAQGIQIQALTRRLGSYGSRDWRLNAFHLDESIFDRRHVFLSVQRIVAAIQLECDFQIRSQPYSQITRQCSSHCPCIDGTSHIKAHGVSCPPHDYRSPTRIRHVSLSVNLFQTLNSLHHPLVFVHIWMSVLQII